MSAHLWKKWSTCPKAYSWPEQFPSLPVCSPLGVHEGQLWDFPGENLYPQTYRGERSNASQILKIASAFLPEKPFAVSSYLWGGTILPHLDCSGYVQTVFRLGGISLPRDADQQYQICEKKNSSELEKGDLIFFQNKKDYPTHVGICLSKTQFIHSSPRGDYSGVKINSLNGDGKYEKFLRSIFLGTGSLEWM